MKTKNSTEFNKTAGGGCLKRLVRQNKFKNHLFTALFSFRPSKSVREYYLILEQYPSLISEFQVRANKEIELLSDEVRQLMSKRFGKIGALLLNGVARISYGRKCLTVKVSLSTEVLLAVFSYCDLKLIALWTAASSYFL